MCSEFVISLPDSRQRVEMSNGYPFVPVHILPSPMIKKLAVLIAIAFVLSPSAANAQRARETGGPVELGIDAGVIFGLDDPNTTLVSIPVQDFRLGYFIDDKLELEPRFNLNSIHSGGATLTTYGLEFGLLFIPSGDRIGRGFYIRPLLGVIGVSVSGAGGSNNNGYGGAGVGLKIPFADRRLATRMEANYEHGFGNGSSNQIGLALGVSFFTR